MILVLIEDKDVRRLRKIESIPCYDKEISLTFL